MKLSVRGEYALRALAVWELISVGMSCENQFISEQQNIPKRFLEQILNDLKAGGFVDSRRGVAGGIGSPSPTRFHCESDPPSGRALAPVSASVNGFCQVQLSDEALCPLRSVMKEVRDSIAKILETTTVAELVQRARALRQHPDRAPDFVI